MLSLIKEFAEPSKRLVLMELRSGSKSVNELVENTALKQPNVSNHLSKLRAKGLVKSTKVGRHVYYSLNGPDVETAILSLLKNRSDEETPEVDFETTAKQYAKAAVQGDESSCARFIDLLIRQGVPLLQIYQNVLAEAMNYVSKWYEVEAIDIGQEHLASAITERMMARVVHFASPVLPNGQIALVGCIAGNWHTIGARMLADFMRLSGWKVLFLGANTPIESFRNAIKEHNPNLVLISAAYDANRAEVLKALHLFNELGLTQTGLKIGVGGRATLENPEEFIAAGASFTASNLLTFSKEILPTLNLKP